MAGSEKQRVLDLLNDTRRKTLALIDGRDLTLVAHAATGWRIRDVLGHVAAWEIEAAQAVEAYRRSQEYPVVEIPDYNERAYAARREMSDQAALAEWQAAREAFIAALKAIPPEEYSRVMVCPWSARQTIADMAEDMAGHELEHLHEIQIALGTR